MSSLVLILLLPALVDGCRTPIGVRRVGRESVYEEVTASALRPGVPSEFSREVLGEFYLTDSFEDDPEQALAELHGRAMQDPRRNLVFALAELSFLMAQDTCAKPHYLAAVVYAYGYLFDARFAGAREPYDPRFRIVCDLYNAALTEFLRDEDGNLRIESGLHVLPFGRMRIEATRPGFPWGPEEFSRFLPAEDFAIRGLRDRHRNSGLGAPLIAERTPGADETKTGVARDYLPAKAKVAATAFLRLGKRQEPSLGGEYPATLELYAPFNVIEVEVEGQKVPLEADLTAPLAYGLQTGAVWSFETAGFFSGEVHGFEPGIFMLQPYSPGKIPVVFVHGTISSPARWAEMFNSLQGYRTIREKFQFWFFIYTTGNPISYSAKLLRDALQKVIHDVDPQGKDPALRQMVVLGHSQGGLLTRLAVVDSGSRFWDQIGEAGIQELVLTPDEMDKLRSTLVFQRLPFVRRVIFIATPHRGSFLSSRWYSKLGASLISLPKGIVDLGRKVIGQDASLAEKLGDRLPTSVDNMEPGSDFLVALESLTPPPDVRVHSIIPVDGSGPIEEGDDGVVAYSSAHIEGVESEYVLPWNHSCQSHPLCILEVRRILREHLRSAAAKAP